MTKLLLSLVMTAFVGAAASACDTCEWKKITVEEYVTVGVTKSVPYTREVTKYDHCGTPYTVCVKAYKDVRVAERKCVSVSKWVKVCD